MKALFPESKGEKHDKLMLGLLGISVFTFALLICSFVVAGTANAGFNIIMSSFLNIGFIMGGYHVVKNSKTPIAIGFLIGCASGLSVLNFTNGVYWGQLSHCDRSVGGSTQYSCTNPTAYGAVSAFSVLLFVSQAIMACFLVAWRGALLHSTDHDDDAMPLHGRFGSGSYDDYKVSSSFVHATPSADL